MTFVALALMASSRAMFFTGGGSGGSGGRGAGRYHKATGRQYSTHYVNRAGKVGVTKKQVSRATRARIETQKLNAESFKASQQKIPKTVPVSQRPVINRGSLKLPVNLRAKIPKPSVNVFG